MDAALKAMPNDGGLYVLAADAPTRGGRCRESRSAAAQGHRGRAGPAAAYTMLGILYVRQKRLREAERALQADVTRNPMSVSAGTMLGHVVRRAARDRRKPSSEYKRVLALDPEAPVAANNLAWIYAASGRNTGEALELASTRSARLPDEPNVNDTLGWLYYKNGQYHAGHQAPRGESRQGAGPQLDALSPGLAYASFGRARQSAGNRSTKALAYEPSSTASPTRDAARRARQSRKLS